MKSPKMTKRFLSVMLSVVLVGGMITVTEPQKAEAAGAAEENLVSNGGFDTTTGWSNNSDPSNPAEVAAQTNSAVMVTDYVVYQDFEKASDYNGKWRVQSTDTGTMEFVADPADAKNHVLKYTVTGLTSGSSSTFDFNNGDVQIFEKGKTYTLSYRYKSDASFHGYHANIDSGWTTYDDWMDSSTAWKKVSYEFTPNTSLGDYFQIGFQLLGNGTFYLDDFSVSCGEKEKVTETVHQVFTADFEKEEDINKISDNPGTFAIDTAEKKSGTGSLKLGFTSAWNQFGIGTFALKAGTEYTISYDWKITDYTQVDETQRAYSRLAKPGDIYTGLVLSGFQTSETDWTTVTYSYTPTEDITAAIYMEVGGGTATMWVDNLSVSYKTYKTEKVFSEGIGNCADAEPDNVLVMKDLTEVSQEVSLTAGKKYAYSFMVKNDATAEGFSFGLYAGETLVGGALTGVNKAGDWTKVSGYYVPEANSDKISFKRSGTGTVYIDDVQITEAHTHTYDKEVAKAKYLKSAATCTKKAVYYKSCSCGEKGTETFTYGEALGHSYKNEITKATAKKNGSIVKKCTVCGKETGSKTVIYVPKTVKLSWTTKTYTGNYLKVPTLTVKGSSKSINEKYYTVTGLKKQKKVGTYTVTVKFDSKYYTGIKNKTLTFSIVPKTTSISKTTAAKKGFTVTWKKQSAQTSGYQIQYATNKDFKKAKTKTISSAKTTSYKITKLSANKKYWVRIRTYKEVSGKKLYSSWSKAVTVKTK